MSQDNEPTSDEPIRESDLIEYIAGGCERSMRLRIERQRKIEGSPVQKWITETQAKLRNPLNVDWNTLAKGESEE